MTVVFEDAEIMFTRSDDGVMELQSKVISGIRLLIIPDRGNGECQMEFFIPTPHPVWMNHQAFPNDPEPDGSCFKLEDLPVLQYWVAGSCDYMPLAYSKLSAGWKRRLCDLVDAYFKYR